MLKTPIWTSTDGNHRRSINDEPYIHIPRYSNPRAEMKYIREKYEQKNEKIVHIEPKVA